MHMHRQSGSATRDHAWILVHVLVAFEIQVQLNGASPASFPEKAQEFIRGSHQKLALNLRYDTHYFPYH